MGWTLSIARALRPEPDTVPERVLTEPSDGTGPSLDGRAPVPTVVVVGSASRDLTDEDPRGWRLGGGVS